MTDSIKVKHIQFDGLEIGNTIEIRSGHYAGRHGVIKDMGVFSCMGGALTYTGVRVEVNGLAGTLVLNPADIITVPHSSQENDGLFFAELDI
ncbi:MAG: hypothetical protein E6230_02735 [Paenibacillus dendritiformis]|uniref:hypothetical protein n=1 Tax=uncultured Paenibacillus sp. TaxID=227322 RepID=UPI0025F9185A|nr:hypothetical protein [uncultured Paenibacillus sp.]MDU5141089.1 hypothetical protein [Paenibacillus dendritiformis]